MKHLIMAAGLAVMLTACGSGQKEAGQETENPFFTEYTTPFGVPPFDKIKFEHYKPAMMKGIEEGRKEIDAIVNNPEEPTFENTIVALDQQGALLRKVQIVFGGQNSVNTNDEMQALSREMSPILSKYNDDINLNPKLFARVKAVYDKKDQLGLDKEQMKLLEETYKDFVRGGANLSEADQAKLRELNSEISMLQLTFGQNMLKETNAFKLVIDKKEDLSGLPETLIANAAKAAEEAGMPGKWVFTLQNPSVMPFLQYADNRELREKIFKAYINRGNNNNENDNKEVVRKLVSARLAKAKLMGYEDYAAFALEDRMAKNSANVYKLLDEIWTPALAQAKRELADINAEIKKEGGQEGQVQPRRERGTSLPEARQRARGRLLCGQQAVWHHLHAAEGHAFALSRGSGLRVQGQGWNASGRDLFRLLPEGQQARGRLVRHLSPASLQGW